MRIDSDRVILSILRVIKSNLNLTSTGTFKHLSYAIQGHKIIPNSISTCSSAGVKNVLNHHSCSHTCNHTVSAHAEMNTAKSFIYSKKRSKIVVVVARCRIGKDNNIEFLMSRPCIRCATLLHKLGVHRVIYTIPDGLMCLSPKEILPTAVPSLADRIVRKTLYVKIDAHKRIMSGAKKVELRIPKNFTKTISEGSLVNISNGVGEIIVAEIIKIMKYSTNDFSAAPLIRRVLKKEGVDRILPHIDDINKGVRYLLYDGGKNSRPVFKWEQVIKYGIWAFELKLRNGHSLLK